MRRPLLIVLGVLLSVVLWRGCGGDGPEPGPAVPPRIITPEQLLHLAENADRPLRLRTARDALPGGLSAAMAPLLIDWEASEVDRPDGFVVVHDVNYGGNPLEGTTVLQSVRVPLDGVERVEWILVPLGRGGRRALVHHGQLRFVFREDRPVRLLDVTGEDGGGDAVLHDLVFSWEAWRRPGEGYDVMTGMDPAAYRLGLRVFAGPQRFLEDALAGRDWFATTLRLPGGAAGPAEVLKVVLALGDGVARHTLSELFSEAAGPWLDAAPAGDRTTLAAQWQALQTLARPRDVAKDPRLELSREERTYQTVLRSCATIAHYCVVVAVQRLAERGLDDGVDLDALGFVRLGGDEPWMAEVAGTDLGGLFMRAPLALRWLRANPQALPDRIPGALDEAGLVVRDGGKPVETHYSVSGLTPWGSVAENLIR
jgi:hypothetical protein